MTCNPKWVYIEQNVLNRQKSEDCPDVTNRVFKLKVYLLIEKVTKGELFGAIKCNAYAVEWQKRGLPHIHLLLLLEEKFRPEQLDDVISAEILDRETDPELVRIVTI